MGGQKPSILTALLGTENKVFETKQGGKLKDLYRKLGPSKGYSLCKMNRKKKTKKEHLPAKEDNRKACATSSRFWGNEEEKKKSLGLL